MSLWRQLGFALGLIIVAGASVAQDAAILAPRFDIQRFEVVGDTVLGAEAAQRVVTPFTGEQKDFGDVQQALEALEHAYRERGYGVINVLLPEQDITRGVVRFNIIEPKVDKVAVDGNQQLSTEHVRRSLPPRKEGETPHSGAIASNPQIGTERPVKQTSVLLRSGGAENTDDVNVRVIADRPWRLGATLDDTGTFDTSYRRLGVGYQHTDLFDRDQTLSLRYVPSPTNLNQVSIYGSREDFQCPRPGGGLCVRPGASANYTIVRYGASVSHAFRDEWQSRIAMHAQYTTDLLVPDGQLGIGEPNTVGGYLPRGAANDKRYAAQMELYTPNFAGRMGMSDKWRSRVIGFYDVDGIKRNSPLPTDPVSSQYLSRAGLGLRLSYGKGVSLRFDVAQIVQAFGTRQTDDQRISADLVIIY